jgi:hypothetical protein
MAPAHRGSSDDPLAEWDEIQLLADGIFPSGSESSLLLSSRARVVCKSGAPYLVSVTVGPYFARRDHLSGSALRCFRTDAKMRQEIERIGNEWASLFASDLQTCQDMSQPLCERIAYERGGDQD